MKKQVFLLVLCLLVSCTGQQQPAPSSVPPTSNIALTIPASTETSIPTITPLPPDTVAYYRIRVEYATTSDWSTLELTTPDPVLAMKTVQVNGEPSGYAAGIPNLSLNQPLSEAGRPVSLIVEYAITPDAIDNGLQFRMQKGDVGSGILDIYILTNGTQERIQSEKYSGVVPNSSGLNPKLFSVDLSPLKGTSPWIASVSRAGREKMVWAFYYMWYYPDGWSSSWLKDRPLEWYASASREVIARQVDQAQSAGIDGFISSWWGPGSDTDQNLRKLLDIAREKNFKVSIYFETLAGENEGPLDEASIRRWLAYAIETYRDHPAFMKVDGKPLIVIWASATVPLETWGRVFASLRDEGLDAVYLSMGYNPGDLEVFDGLHDYGVFTYPDLNQTYQSTARAVRYYSLLADQPVSKIWAATVQPGYDDTLQPTREGLIQERENGDYYRFTWEAALKSSPDWIFITTWNEWWEHTHIEPGELYGDEYILITKEYAEAWKGE